MRPVLLFLSAILLANPLGGCATPPAPQKQTLSHLPYINKGFTKRGPATNEQYDMEYDDPLKFFKELKLNHARKHAHLMHLDGFRPDLFDIMIRSGQLPNFHFLMQRAKLSLKASTVDKSETMKVIESYLTSKRDTYVVGWWQFSRESFRFKNFWIDPSEVVNYALGLDFPRTPTVFDILSAKGHQVMAGFSLHRRGVPFENYGRAYAEGGQAAFNHTYFDQLHATTNSTIRILTRMAENGEKPPLFSTSLLAAADEYGHLRGIIRPPEKDSKPGEFCFKRDTNTKKRAKDRLERVFKMADSASDPNELDRFSHIDWDEDRTTHKREAVKICISIPKLTTHSDASTETSTTIGKATEQYADPFYILGMTMVDMEVGRLIDTMRSIRFRADGSIFFDSKTKHGIYNYINAAKAEGSLFENTLFVITGDHGMVDSKFKMFADPKHLDHDKQPSSFDLSLIEILNNGLALKTMQKTEGEVDPTDEIGIDDTLLPGWLALPFKYSDWQSKQVAASVAKASAWVKGALFDLKAGIKDSLYHKYWFLGLLRGYIINPKLNKEFASYEQKLFDTLMSLYLKTDATYQKAEHEAIRRFFERHIRLVYGGGARNNAEIFIPATEPNGSPSWATRPTFEQLLAYRGGSKSKQTLLETLRANPGVGLIFIRKNNTEISMWAEPPASMEIFVMDRFANTGHIRIKRDSSGELTFGYKVDKESPHDPLGYTDLDRNNWTFKNYSEWNDHSIEKQYYYHNVVAGMGSYLYSTNPAIGDVTVMHSQGWNFGDNSGGHGGVHAEEKITIMLVSGPEISGGELLAKSAHDPAHVHYPTVLDIAPSVLKWLGFSDKDIRKFAVNDFAPYLQEWIKKHNETCSTEAVMLVEEIAVAAKSPFTFSPTLRTSMERTFDQLCKGLPANLPPLPDLNGFSFDGNYLEF